MKIEFDFSELYKFADNLSDENLFDNALISATQLIAKVLHQNLLKFTPVKTGRLRKMWDAGDNLLFTVEKVDNGFEVTLVNKARSGKDAVSGDESTGFMYGLAVEEGHKIATGGWVKGKFFVKDSVAKTAKSSELERIIMGELQKWWDKL